MTLELSAEEGLLVTAAAGRCAAPVAGGPVRWEALGELARWHRVLPLLWAHVRDGGALVPADVPAPVLDALRGQARGEAARTLQLQFELDRALGALDGAGIPVVLLKGAALAGTVYPDPGLRPMIDLDLLVGRDDVQRALEVVQPLGYDVSGAALGRDDEARLATIHHHFPLTKSGGAVVIELHHGVLVDRLDFDVQGIWDRSASHPGGRPCRLPSPEDLFLHVAVHFAFDRIQRGASSLGQVADVVRIADRWPLDWPAVVERARANEVADRLFLALHATDALAGAVAPAEVVDELRPAGFTEELGEQFVRQRVLVAEPALPLEQLRHGGLRRIFPGRGALERYVRPEDGATPSVARLHARRVRALTRRLVHEAPAPHRLAEDVRLTRWLVGLRE